MYTLSFFFLSHVKLYFFFFSFHFLLWKSWPISLGITISHAYHSLHIQDSRTLIDVLLGSNGTSCKLRIKCPLKLLNMVFDIAIHGCDLHQLAGIHLSQFLYVHGSSFFVYPMMSLGIIFQDLVNFLEFKLLEAYKRAQKSKENQPVKNCQHG